MTGFVGMDPQQIRGIAGRLNTQAALIERVINTVTQAVAEARSEWDGQDAHDFEGWWTSHHRPRLLDAHRDVQTMAEALRRNADEQEQASGGAGASGALGVLQQAAGTLRDGVTGLGGGQPFSFGAFAGGAFDWGTWGNDLVETGRGADLFAGLPHGSFWSASVSGVGLGLSAVDLGGAMQAGDGAGMVKSGIDMGMTFAAAPVSALWTGLSAETGFFLPLDQQSADDHVDWMIQQGYTGEQIADRYSGVQGFIQYGNDNVERHAPWMNDIADAVTQKPAEWLYNVGIKL